MTGKLALISLSLALVIGCTHTISRSGYILDDAKISSNCEVQFEKNAPVDSSRDKIIGEVKLGDSGFSTSCGEDDALAILKKEACGAGANVVNIIEEKRSDIISSCYRVTALLIKTTGANKQEEISGNYKHDVDEKSVDQRVSADHARNTAIIIVSIVLGFIIGFTLVSIH